MLIFDFASCELTDKPSDICSFYHKSTKPEYESRHNPLFLKNSKAGIHPLGPTINSIVSVLCIKLFRFLLSWRALRIYIYTCILSLPLLRFGRVSLFFVPIGVFDGDPDGAHCCGFFLSQVRQPHILLLLK